MTSWRFARNVYASALPKNMTFPVYIPLGSLKIHPHLVFETLAYAIAFRMYLLLRKRNGDLLDDRNRWWMIAAAAMGAVVGSKVLYWFEDPAMMFAHWRDQIGRAHV